MSIVDDVHEFHTKFQLPKSLWPGFPTDDALTKFRIAFLKEEIMEFEHACEKKDLTEAFDALIDLIYVALGTSEFFNLPFQEGWDIVHAANMKKIRVYKESDSKRGSIYDIKKPEGWVSPNDDLRKLILSKIADVG